MTLRTTGHLLLGIVRIYSKKAKFLLADCNEAFMKIKMAFRSGGISAIEDNDLLQHVASSLPQTYTDFDTALPDFDADFNTHLQAQQSRIDDITLKEDNMNTNNLINDDFGMDDFGETELGMAIDDDFGDLGNLENDTSTNDFGDISSSVDINGQQSSSMFDDNDVFGNSTGIEDETEPGSMAENGSAMASENPREGSEELMTGPRAGSIAGDSDNYSVETNEMEKTERRRRKRKLVIDEQKNIGGDEMKSNMANYSDTIQSLDLAPPTRKLMRIRQLGNVEKLFHLPGCSHMKSKPLVRVYQSHLSARPKPNSVVVDDLKKALLLSDILEDSIYHLSNSTFGDDQDEFSAPSVPDLDLQPESPPTSQLDSSNEAKDDDISPSEKKKRNKEPKNVDDDDQAVEGDEDHRWTKRTQGILNSIATKLRSSEDEQYMGTAQRLLFPESIRL
ncbi:hypothetical protein WR25_03843 isoform C [Diploscapter pachys]|uniref:Rad21/Rec8-like protein N-terminal domain-containing protein n=1 Tax=Diploscapter pachys TaxID=2018661 RepID=A0A2A2M194_9BILA|nr:hypothetical protein WR25_03843 isoform C [Diploscapter pachys]